MTDSLLTLVELKSKQVLTSHSPLCRSPSDSARYRPSSRDARQSTWRSQWCPAHTTEGETRRTFLTNTSYSVRYLEFQPQIFLVFLTSSHFNSQKNSKLCCLSINIQQSTSFILWSEKFSFLLQMFIMLGGTPPRHLRTWSQMSWKATVLLPMFNFSLLEVINQLNHLSLLIFSFLLYKCIYQYL